MTNKKYTSHKLRIGLNNAESSLRWLADKNPSTMTVFDHKAIELNMLRIAKFQKLLTASKAPNFKYF